MDWSSESLSGLADWESVGSNLEKNKSFNFASVQSSVYKLSVSTLSGCYSRQVWSFRVLDYGAL